MKKPYVFYSLLLAGSIVASCAKDDAPPLDAKTKAITSHTWRVSAFILVAKNRPSGEPDTVDAYASFPAWLKDNTYRFFPDNTYEEDEGRIKKWPSDPQKIKGNWQFEDNQRKIALGLGKVNPSGTVRDNPDNFIIFDLFELNDSVFRYGCECSPQSNFRTLTPE